MKKVSVLIPLYNSELYIEETIRSVLNQTWQNIEVIVVDDGSTDRSLEIVKSLQSDVIKLYSQKNTGACSARNFAFKNSTGDYIQYLDADDLLAPDKIERQMLLLGNSEEGYITSGVWGKFKDSIDNVVWSEDLLNEDFVPSYNWLLKSWKGGGMGQTAIWLTPRSLIQKVGPWHENLKINQDGEFFSRIILQSNGIFFCEGAKVYYRSGLSRSISQKNKFSREKSESLLLSFQLYKKHALDNNLLEKLKEGLGQNFLKFIYQYYGAFNDLTGIAENEFYSLGYKKMWAVGGKNFLKLSAIVGFKNALRIKNLLTSTIHFR